VFEPSAFEMFIEWIEKDVDIFYRIVRLIEVCRRTPFEGMTKPKPLKGKLLGFWSRKIDKKHRLIYFVDAEKLFIVSCEGHYDDT